MKTAAIFLLAILGATQAVSFFNLVAEEWNTFKVQDDYS